MNQDHPTQPAIAVHAGGRDLDAPHDESLLERARQLWIAGDWESLTKLDVGALERHPDRAKLALIIGSAWQHVNDHASARRMVGLAIDWGCDRKLIARVLIANVHNTLARSAALNEDAHKALGHFRAAVSAGRGGVSFSSSMRAQKELERIGLAISGDTSTVALVKTQRAAVGSSAEPVAKPDAGKPATTLSPEALRFYEGYALSARQDVPPRFVLIESKSLPRSGLHFLKSVLLEVLREDFSFCEWYQEPGCCKRMPCALTGFATEAERAGRLRIRLTKSHDFQLKDPVHDINRSLRRVILVRNPLYVLTSYFALEQLRQYEKQLNETGIVMAKIWLAHEPEVIHMAYDVMDRNFVAPAEDVLAKWLKDKVQYCVDFLNKWLVSANETGASSVVSYGGVTSYVSGLLSELKPNASPQTLERIENFLKNAKADFRPRQNPFTVPSSQLSSYIRGHRHLFVEAAREIMEKAPRRLAAVLGDEQTVFAENVTT